MAELRPATRDQQVALMMATDALKLALAEARRADCPALVKRLRAALDSAEGAERHMRRRLGAAGI